MDKELVSKLVKLGENTEFVDALQNTDSKDEALAVFKSYGVDLSLEELEKMIQTGTGNGELSEEALENVAGGRFNWRVFWKGFKDALRYFV